MGKSVAGNADLEEVQDTLDVHATDLSNLYSRPYAYYSFPTTQFAGSNGTMIQVPELSYGMLPLEQRLSPNAGFTATGDTTKTYMFHVSYSVNLNNTQPYAGPYRTNFSNVFRGNTRVIGYYQTSAATLAEVAAYGTVHSGAGILFLRGSNTSDYLRLEGFTLGSNGLAYSNIAINNNITVSSICITLLNVY